MKKVKALLALTALVAMVTVSSVAFAEETVTVTTNVGDATSIVADCWKFVAGDAPNWQWSGASVALEQPEDRFWDGTFGGDPADTWGDLAGIAWYDEHGGNPGGPLTTENKNAFGYGDCKINITTSSQIWAVDLKGGDFVGDNDLNNTISTMVGADTVDFDFTLENEDNSVPEDRYEATEEEYGFYVVGAARSFPIANTNAGEAFGITYNNPRSYMARNCGDGTRQCYHGLDSATGHVLFEETILGLEADDAFVTRFGIGVVGGETPTASDDYGMTAVFTVTF